MSLHDRARPLASIRTAMAHVRDGAATLVAVTGAPGMGRSVFLDAVGEVAARDGFLVRRVGGSRLDQGLSLGVVGRLLPQGDLDAGARRAAVVDAVVAAERAAAPVAFLVDDLQWADETSLDWLARLLADPEPAPLLLVVTVCEGESATELPGVQDLLLAADQVVRMGPLSVDGVRALLRDRGVVLADAPGRAWTRATGGSPTLVNSLLDRLEAARPPAPARLLAVARARPAPWHLRGRVAAALSSHVESVRRLAYCAAILGGVADARTVARVADLDPAEAAAAERALHRLGWVADLCEPPVLWDCVREIAEEGLALDDRTTLHRRAAELLYASGSPVERVTPHLLEVGPGEWPEAARVLREAADDARRRGDLGLAIRCLRRALRECPPDSPQRGDFLAALADAEQDTDTSAMLRHLTQAIPLLASARERAAVVASAPLTLFVFAPAASEMIESARATLATVPASDLEAVDLGLRLEARARLLESGGPDASAAAVKRLRELDPGPGAGTAAQRELVAVLAFVGTLGVRLRAAEVAELVRWMLDHEPASAASGYAAPSLMIACGIAAGADDSVRSWLDMALEAARQRGDERQRTRVLGWRALAGLHAGRLADAWSDARDACAADPGALDDNDWLAVLGLMSVAAETRDPLLADRLRALPAEPRDTGLPMRSLALQVLRASSATATEPPVPVAGLLATVRRTEEAGWHNQTLFPMGLWCLPSLLRLGETGNALEILARAGDRARAFGSPTTLGRVLRIWGTLVRERYALSLLAESVAVLRESPNTLELGRALTAYGNRLRAAGRPGSAEVLAEADRIADATGASLLRRWTGSPHGELLGVVLPGGGRLSDAERRVAALVALGHTNQDAAAELGVTRRAVEKTLTGLYRRLGVEGRAGLVPFVRRMAGEAAFRSGTLSDRL
ncbi:DNA-binding CsgD family transcriptional regulator [Streptomyces umbrinus]|uniref:DNA-binding CsgD family transcriptional regulator n=1 Tax=Streptomyces umbrinus TaxID=67370 RepID=A0ABU0SNA9_9ACTN|nr:AAA family ATPase [Streptomyces umbrinus]MDQ1025049.1 DNA-binding CsgD family transcriptional regulator [Streptomyces umbrinus]